MAKRENFWEAIKRIHAVDDSYKHQGYVFLMESLDFTMRQLGERRHVSAHELLDGLCVYARGRYGPLAADVLNSWGMRSERDIGRAIFHLVDAGVLSKQESDSPEDFHIDYDLPAKLVERYFG